MSKIRSNELWLVSGILLISCATLVKSAIDEPGTSTRVGSNVSPLPSDIADRWTTLYHNVFDSRIATMHLTPEQVRASLLEMNELEKHYPALRDADVLAKLIGDSFGSKFIALINFMKQHKSASDINSSLIETLLDTFNPDAINCSDNNLKKYNELVNKTKTHAELVYPILRDNFKTQFKNCLERYMKIIEKSAEVMGTINLANLNDILDQTIDRDDGWTPFSIESIDQHKAQIVKLAHVLIEHLNSRLKPNSSDSFEPEYLRFYREPCGLFVSLAKQTISKIDRMLSLVNEKHITMKLRHTRYLNLYRLCSRMGLDKRFYQFRSVLAMTAAATLAQQPINPIIQQQPEQANLQIEQKQQEQMQLDLRSTRPLESPQVDVRNQLAEIMKTSPLFKPATNQPSINTRQNIEQPKTNIDRSKEVAKMILNKRIKFPFSMDPAPEEDVLFRDPIGQRASQLLKTRQTPRKPTTLAKKSTVARLRKQQQGLNMIAQMQPTSPALSEESVSNNPSKKPLNTIAGRQDDVENTLIFNSLPTLVTQQQNQPSQQVQQQQPPPIQRQLQQQQIQQDQQQFKQGSEQGSTLAKKDLNKMNMDLWDDDDDGLV